MFHFKILCFLCSALFLVGQQKADSLVLERIRNIQFCFKVEAQLFVSKVNRGRMKKFFCMAASICIGIQFSKYAAGVWINALNSLTFISSHHVNAV